MKLFGSRGASAARKDTLEQRLHDETDRLARVMDDLMSELGLNPKETATCKGSKTDGKRG